MAQFQRCDYAQIDERWGKNLLGFAKNERIAQFGCYVTSGANVAKWYGKDIDPGSLNELMKQRKLFCGEPCDLVSRDDFLAVIWPDIKFIEAVDWPQNVLAPMSYFDIRSSKTVEIIVQIDYHPDRPGLQTHFCRVIGLNGNKNDLEIVDSYDGRRKWLSSIANRGGKTPQQLIWKAVKYELR